MTAYLGLLQRRHADTLLARLRARGYRVLGPRVRDGAIVLAPLQRWDQLPEGLEDDTAPGHYRLRHAGHRHCFRWSLPQQGLKPWVFPPEERLWRVQRRHGHHLRFQAAPTEAPRYAVLGVRACELAALDLLDRHFLAEPHPDPRYRARRQGLFLIAVHCQRAAATCFCASTGDGPRARDGYDLALSELDQGYLVEAGSEAGHAVAETLPLIPAAPELQAEAERAIRACARQQRRALPSRQLRDALHARRDAAHWQTLQGRCLSCSGCTAVCPTCFCHRHRDQPHPIDDGSDHLRHWDSCFTPEHSRLHGIVVRAALPARYRQWLLHKLAYWHDQYGRAGCVGCGRCISACPAAIDLTAEVQALLATPEAGP